MLGSTCRWLSAKTDRLAPGEVSLREADPEREEALLFPETKRLFARRQFRAGKRVRSAVLEIACRDMYKLYVNGHFVCRGPRRSSINVICYSSDEGKSWTRPAPVIDTPLDDRDSGVVSFGKGRVIFTSFNNSIAAQRAWMERLGEDTPEQAASKAFTRAYIELLAARPDSERLLGSTYRISDDGGTVFGPVRLSPVTSPHGPMPTRALMSSCFTSLPT